jgi:hypothetical protein
MNTLLKVLKLLTGVPRDGLHAMSGVLTLADGDRHDSHITPEQFHALTATALHRIGP